MALLEQIRMHSPQPMHFCGLMRPFLRPWQWLTVTVLDTASATDAFLSMTGRHIRVLHDLASAGCTTHPDVLDRAPEPGQLVALEMSNAQQGIRFLDFTSDIGDLQDFLLYLDRVEGLPAKPSAMMSGALTTA